MNPTEPYIILNPSQPSESDLRTGLLMLASDMMRKEKTMMRLDMIFDSDLKYSFEFKLVKVTKNGKDLYVMNCSPN